MQFKIMTMHIFNVSLELPQKLIVIEPSLNVSIKLQLLQALISLIFQLLKFPALNFLSMARAVKLVSTTIKNKKIAQS